ncbi:ankyrin repeat domain-containing protein SOWAHD [Menidia menidia]
MHEGGSNSAGCGPAVAHGGPAATQGSLVERLSRYGMQVMPGAQQRRSRLQRQPEVPDQPAQSQRDVWERGSVTSVKRRKQLKELLLSIPFSGSLPPESPGAAPQQQDADWALSPMEHEWMLAAVEGSYETILEYVAAEPALIGRRDFVSGYSVLHWLAKRGQDETLLRLLRHAERGGVRVDVNVRGSGGLTPLHLASAHGQYAVVKLLVGAYGADVDAMDYSGRRAWQYLRGDAPLEMRELLGTWDEEHNSEGTPQNFNRNVNNNCAGGQGGPVAPDEQAEDAEEVKASGQMTRSSSWRFGPLRKLISSFQLLGSKT